MPKNAATKIQEILDDHQVQAAFPEHVLREVEALTAEPGIDDPTLQDLTALPFVTIDYEQSKDLDQALLIQRLGDGYRVLYALADAAHYVRPGTALFREALARGVSLYLPGRSVPMLPPELSEGIVSLNAGVDRRAMVFATDLDGEGQVLETRITRARIRSRAKLTYDGVQAMIDAGWTGADGDQAYTESLKLLAVVGDLRMAEARRRDVVTFDREELEVEVQDGALVLTSRPRNMVSRYNEQISLLCNAEGGRLMLGDGEPQPQVQPVYRVHEPPAPDGLDRLEQILLALARAHGLVPERLAWRRGEESLGDYLGRVRGSGLPSDLTRAVQRQALIANSPSRFTAHPGLHYALGVRPYARFSAPMREMVGVFTHKEAAEKLGLAPASRSPEQDEELRELVIQAGNRGKERQRTLDRAVRRMAIHELLSRDLALPVEQRPARPGTVMGLRPSRAYLQLHDPPVELKVYLGDLERWAGAPMALSEDGVILAAEGGPRVLMGGELTVRLAGRDDKRKRWKLSPV